MNSFYPMMEPVIKESHEERLKRAERLRLIKESRSNDGKAPGVRARLGMVLMRTGARIMPEGQGEFEFKHLENRAA